MVCCLMLNLSVIREGGGRYSSRQTGPQNSNFSENHSMSAIFRVPLSSLSMSSPSSSLTSFYLVKFGVEQQTTPNFTLIGDRMWLWCPQHLQFRRLDKTLWRRYLFTAAVHGVTWPWLLFTDDVTHYVTFHVRLWNSAVLCTIYVKTAVYTHC